MSAGTQTGRGVFGRLYRGETRIEFIGHRKRWYLASATLIVICLLAIGLRGFNWGIEFSGGNQFQLPIKPGTTLSQVRDSVEGAGIQIASAQTAGSGGTATYVIKTEKLTDAQRHSATAALASSAHVPADQINTNEVSSSWGGEVTRQAVIALIVFLLAVGVFMALRFRDARASGAALLALLHDLLLTAGIYALSGFEVTPGTVVGLLTILGYSLYDTVVVFDKVDENTKGILGSSRYTYGEAANLAVNQSLMRSINTSLIGLLPVAGLLFVGAGVLGVGTLEDLALVLFVGMITGAYSSLFLATPWLVSLKMMDPRYRNHALRIRNKRAAAEKSAVGKPQPGPGSRQAGQSAAGRQSQSGPAAGRQGQSGPAAGRQKSGGSAEARVDADSVAVVDPVDLDTSVGVGDSDELSDESTEARDGDSIIDADRAARLDALAGAAPRVGAKPSAQSGGPKRPGGGRSAGRTGGKRRHG